MTAEAMSAPTTRPGIQAHQAATSLAPGDHRPVRRTRGPQPESGGIDHPRPPCHRQGPVSVLSPPLVQAVAAVRPRPQRSQEGEKMSLDLLGPADGDGHAVVIGSSLAGLTAAQALVDHVDRVTVIERDRLPLALAGAAVWHSPGTRTR
ncbi:NAD-binding protein [Streptomyces sp. M10(2022)]